MTCPDGARRPLTVLVVDDFPDTAESLAAILAVSGCDVRTASSAAEALGRLDGWQPDAAVLDLALPGDHGIELARRLCERSRRRPLLLAVTGMQGERGQALAGGFDHFFLKPVDPGVLVGLLEAHAARLGDGAP